MQIVIGQQRGKGIRVIEFTYCFARFAYAPAITRRRNREHWRERENGFEEPFRGNFQSRNRICVAFEDYACLAGIRKKRAHDEPLPVSFASDVWSEQVERIRVLRTR